MPDRTLPTEGRSHIYRILLFVLCLCLAGCGAAVQVSARGQSVTSVGVGSR